MAIKLLYGVHSVYFQVDSVNSSFTPNSSTNSQIENEDNVLIKNSILGYDFTSVDRILACTEPWVWLALYTN